MQQLRAASLWGVSGAAPSSQIVDDLIAVLFPVAGTSTASRAAAIAYLDSIPGAGDPEKVEQGAAFLLSMPEFLNH
jgi:hypothetical protein